MPCPGQALVSASPGPSLAPFRMRRSCGKARAVPSHAAHTRRQLKGSRSPTTKRLNLDQSWTHRRAVIELRLSSARPSCDPPFYFPPGTGSFLFSYDQTDATPTIV
jgi:hypothetical protein